MESSSPQSAHGLGRGNQQSAAPTANGEPPDVYAAANTISAILWNLRSTLEQILAVVEQDHQLPGQNCPLPQRSGALQGLIGLLYETEFRRVIEMGPFTDDQLPLRKLAREIPAGPWELIFDAHRTALAGLVAAVTAALSRDSGARAGPLSSTGAVPSTLREFLR